MKKYIEVRGADAGNRAMTLALPAIWKGLFYDETARSEAASLLDGISPEEHAQLFEEIRTDALAARGGEVLEMARKLVTLAGEGLDRLATEAGHDSERVFLAPLEEQVATGKTGADRMLEDFQEVGGDRRAMIEKWAF